MIKYKLIFVATIINVCMAISFLILTIVDLIGSGNSYGYFFIIYLATTLVTKLINK